MRKCWLSSHSGTMHALLLACMTCEVVRVRDGVAAGVRASVCQSWVCLLSVLAWCISRLQAAETTGILAEGGQLRVSRAGAHKAVHQVRSSPSCMAGMLQGGLLA